MSWSADQYVIFEEQRTRPVRDLLAALPDSVAPKANPTKSLTPRGVATGGMRCIDLGCGPGNSTEVLAARFPGAVIGGIDSSADMLEAARRLMREIAAEGPWAQTLARASAERAPLASAEWYYERLRASCGSVEVWRTTYYHALPGAAAIVEWFTRRVFAALHGDGSARLSCAVGWLGVVAVP